MATKRTNKEKLQAANARARNEREGAGVLTIAASLAPTAAAMLAPTVAEYIPGPSQTEIEEWGKKKQSGLRSKKVLIPLGIGAGAAFFGGGSLPLRIVAMLSGGVAGAMLTYTQVAMEGNAMEIASAAKK